jgi:DNA-binding transcriptional LysR family regulator
LVDFNGKEQLHLHPPKRWGYQQFGLGVGAVLSHPVLGSGIAAVPLDEPGAQIEVHVAWRKDERPPTVLAFLNSVRKVFHRKRVGSA